MIKDTFLDCILYTQRQFTVKDILLLHIKFKIHGNVKLM